MADTNNLFMQVDGVKGSSTDKSYKDWIIIDDFDLSIMNGSTYDGSSGLSSGSNIYIHPISIVKRSDISSLGLIDLLQQAKPIKEIVLVKTQHINDKRSEERRIKLKNCFIVSYDSKLQNAAQETSERFVLAFGTIQQETNMITANGSLSKQGPIGWDRTTNTKL